MFERLKDEIDGIIARDPAARSRLEVVLTYPSFHVVVLHRLANHLWRADWRILARWVSYVARFTTGIEIHPGATIGRRLFIDHGLGVVIGETAEIGDDVTLYQDVTLGGVSPSVDSRNQVGVKRHPTLLDGVIVGSGAQILGPITVGEGARVGANAVVVNEVAPNTTVVGIPAKPVGGKARLINRNSDFCAYGIMEGRMPDPTEAEIETLTTRVAALVERVAELEARLGVNEPCTVIDAVRGKVAAGEEARQ